jgi:hypothetical protein
MITMELPFDKNINYRGPYKEHSSSSFSLGLVVSNKNGQHKQIKKNNI